MRRMRKGTCNCEVREIGIWRSPNQGDKHTSQSGTFKKHCLIRQSKFRAKDHSLTQGNSSIPRFAWKTTVELYNQPLCVLDSSEALPRFPCILFFSVPYPPTSLDGLSFSFTLVHSPWTANLGYPRIPERLVTSPHTLIASPRTPLPPLRSPVPRFREVPYN